MVIRQHHFFDTWYSVTGAKNKELQHEVLLNEIANIIVARPDLAISNLVKAGIDINQDADEKEITEVYQQNLYKPELAKLTALEIVAGNKISFDGKDYSKPFFNADTTGGHGGGGGRGGSRPAGGVGGRGGGGGYSNGGGADYGALATAVVGLGTAIAGNVQASKEAKRVAKLDREAKKREKDNRLMDLVMQKKAMIESQIAAISSQKGKNKNKTLYLVLGISGGVLVIGAILAYVIKSKTSTT